MRNSNPNNEPGRANASFGDNDANNEHPQEEAVHNRIRAVLKHTTRYAFQSQSRLARDIGVSRSTISRLLRGKVRPSFALVFAVTRALEEDLGRRLDPRELISPDGTYPTPFVCSLVGCRGCLPEEAYDEHGNVRSHWENVLPGRWSSLGRQEQ